ncbi:CheR family methyltransferase [Cohnella rhizosphaerae]|uniref:protein-glutamate O-methyltransferase n=1 Tax=Cohnella rhizosphaerae TaxID=1457232 RepID=A0A9X4L553_9BACL|nr:protein-glutamate O-methyltransferase CheR [Cohnella rhizosphaerae]MDG0813667.1 protein-glutamate O-methyltransferase CheR [Cohnella rhizosphaerae]
MDNHIQDEEFDKLAETIRLHAGIYLRREKKALLVSRLGRLLEQHGAAGFDQYISRLAADRSGRLLSQLIDHISTNHTFFMRETPHFDFMRDVALPYWMPRIADRDLRVWSAGCSTGEEPYTLAMLLQDFLGPQAGEWDSRVLATDISARTLETAALGVYSQDAVRPLPESWKRLYFRRLPDNTVRVQDSLRAQVLFRRFNLMEQRFPFSRPFHIIFCRNVMIYFDERARNQLLRKFWETLAPGGYLFIGHSEGIGRKDLGFSYVSPSVYRKPESEDTRRKSHDRHR